jgi:hypothetical protein
MKAAEQSRNNGAQSQMHPVLLHQWRVYQMCPPPQLQPSDAEHKGGDAGTMKRQVVFAA